MTRPPTVVWRGSIDGHLELLDQRALPGQTVILRIETVAALWEAIRTLAVRGAPAIGVAAGYGMVLAARKVPCTSQAAVLIGELEKAGTYLRSSRPTAVNLEWAVNRILAVAIEERGIGVRPLLLRLLAEAETIREEDTAMCQAIGRHGAGLISPGMGVLTHCNAGALATSNHGTALAILYEAQRRKIDFHVFADETRPLLQGSRLTAWELAASGIDVTVICDSMAGLVMRQGKVGLVIVGADRIAANGDTANKIGTYAVAQLARVHGIPFVVAAPASTFDFSLRDGGGIPIEERRGEEITEGVFGGGTAGQRTAPLGIKTYNPAFDVTPAELIGSIVTDRGVISPVNAGTIQRLFGEKG